MNNLPKVSRVEVINHAVAEDNPDYGRAYVYWPEEPIEVSYDLQDNDRTLKVFIEKKSMNNEHTVAPTDLEKLKEEARKRIVDRFLGWHLPENFSPDAGISFERGGYKGTPWPMPTGTNLLDATQAKEMVRDILGDELEKAFTAGKEKGADDLIGFLQLRDYRLQPRDTLSDLLKEYVAAHTNNSLD